MLYMIYHMLDPEFQMRQVSQTGIPARALRWLLNPVVMLRLEFKIVWLFISSCLWCYTSLLCVAILPSMASSSCCGVRDLFLVLLASCSSLTSVYLLVSIMCTYLFGYFILLWCYGSLPCVAILSY